MHSEKSALQYESHELSTLALMALSLLATSVEKSERYTIVSFIL